MFKIYKLKHTLIIIFVILSLASTLIIGVFSNIFIKSKFNKYVMYSLDIKKEKILSDISIIYEQNNSFDQILIENVGMNALKEGLIIKVIDQNDETIWNARTHNNGMCDEILKKMSSSMHKLHPNFKGTYTTDVFSVVSNREVVGKLSISYYGPYFYTDSEIIFFKFLNILLVIISLFYVLFSILIGWVVASFIEKPLNKVMNSTKLISEGNYETIKLDSKIIEIDALVKSINKLSENLANQENLRKTLTKDISHELRTPLTVIQGFLEALIDGIWEPTTERLESIYKEIQRLTRLTHSLEDLIKYESENQSLNLSRVEISSFLKEIIILFEKDLYDKGIKCYFEIEENYVYLDKDKMSQAIINIVSNSIKYSKKNGEIFIKTFKKDEKIIISIKDNGIGIAKKHIPFLFERFYRVDDSRSRLTGGVGVGLTISKSIIDLHEGNIIVKSEENMGSEFLIIFKILK